MSNIVRHMMKLSDPEAIQAAIQAGTLAEPYIINITQDSSVSGYESKGIYIQESSTGTPSMNVKEYEEPQQNWWEEVDWNQDGVVFRGQNNSVGETLESFNDEGYATDLLGEDIVLLINPTFANGQLSGGRAVHALQDEENENGRYFVNVNLQAGVPCYIACMNAGNYVLSAVCEEEYDLDGISYSVENVGKTTQVVIGECYGPNTPVPDSSADWYQLHFADNYNDTFYDYSEETFKDITALAGFIESDVYGYMFETTTASVALVIDGSFNDGYVSGGTCVLGTFVADSSNSGTFRFENCQISDSSTVMLLIDAYGEDELSYDPSINVRCSKFVVGAAPFGYNITNGVEWSVALEIDGDTGDTHVIVGEITDIGDESGDSSQGDGTSSTAHIYSFIHDDQNDWTDENYETHEHYIPVVDMFNNDASINYFQCGYYDVAEEENPWSSIEDLYENYAQTYVELTQIFDGSTNASWQADELAFDTYSNVQYKFIGRYVNATYSQTTDEWDNPIDLYTVNSAKPWIILGQHPEPGPEVMYGSPNDNSNGTVTFEAYLNTPAVDENYYYKAGCTSNHDWNQLMEQEQNMADWDTYVQSCLDSSVYTGTEDNPDTVTVHYSNSEDDGDVVVAMFDDQDNYVYYETVGNWSTISM